MERKMMLGLKQRAEAAVTQRGPATSAADDGRLASSRQSP
jgi:hypothetical protein